MNRFDWAVRGALSMLVVACVALFGQMMTLSGADAKVSKTDDTKVTLMSLRGAIAVFKIRLDRWPRTLDELVEARVIEQVPADGWTRPFLWMRPIEGEGSGCLLSAGADGRPGSTDDLIEGCDLRLLNQHLLVTAGLDAAADRLDAYGNPIRLVPRSHSYMTWSYGPDGRPDTEDDQVARVAKKKGRR